jgi:hypothetical protein
MTPEEIEIPVTVEPTSVIQEVEAPAIDPIPEEEQPVFEESKVEADDIKSEYIFNFIMHKDSTLEFKNYSKEEYSIMELLGAAMHFIFGGTKKVYDKTMEANP